MLDRHLSRSEIGLRRIYENMQADGAIPADRTFDLSAVTDDSHLRAAQASVPTQR